MSFLNNLRDQFIRFMIGRNGSDQLGMASLIAAIILTFLGSLTGFGLFPLLGNALYIWAIFRMFSRNLLKRREENRKFMIWFDKAKKLALRYWTRLKNIREYKYFSCPQCKASIRMKRGKGEKEITCPGCQHVFKQKS